jgi:hypothetical protein
VIVSSFPASRTAAATLDGEEGGRRRRTLGAISTSSFPATVAPGAEADKSGCSPSGSSFAIALRRLRAERILGVSPVVVLGGA